MFHITFYSVNFITNDTCDMNYHENLNKYTEKSLKCICRLCYVFAMIYTNNVNDTNVLPTSPWQLIMAPINKWLLKHSNHVH